MKKTNVLKMMVSVACMLAAAAQAGAFNVNYQLSLKQPGNAAVTYSLTSQNGQLNANRPLPLTLREQLTKQGDVSTLTLTLTANERIYFNLGISLLTDYRTDDCEFYLPGFWYQESAFTGISSLLPYFQELEFQGRSSLLASDRRLRCPVGKHAHRTPEAG